MAAENEVYPANGTYYISMKSDDSPVDLNGASRRFVAKPKQSQNASREVMPQNYKLV